MDSASAPRVLILEDDPYRIERFRAVLESIDRPAGFRIWSSAAKMINDLDAYLPAAGLISLDHDLEPRPGEFEDPGDGMDVVRFLTTRQPSCPVIVHSSNLERAAVMVRDLTAAGWQTTRVIPLPEQWIENDWASAVRQAMKTSL